MLTRLPSELARPTNLDALICIVPLNCVTALSIDMVDFRASLSEVELWVCLLRVYTTVDYFLGSIQYSYSEKGTKVGENQRKCRNCRSCLA